MTSSRLVEAFIINYNGKNTVLSTIESLYKSEDVKVSISVIDDHSTDGSPELIRSHYPEIPVHILPINTKRANILRNKALGMAGANFVFITDNYLKYDTRCIAEMQNLMERDEKIASCTPRFMYWNQPDKIYIAGTRVHYIGAAISDMRDKIYEANKYEPSVNSGSGICLVRREVALKIGGFDTNLMQGWGSDGEFYQRLLRAGYKCFYVPKAFALHEDKLVVTERKFRVIGATYNRWVFILTHYSFVLILLLIPPFILYEIFQIAFVLMKRILSQYLKGNFLVLKNLPSIWQKRKFVQNLKVVSDKEVLFAGNIYVAPALVENKKFIKMILTVFSSVLNIYWRIIKKIIP